MFMHVNDGTVAMYRYYYQNGTFTLELCKQMVQLGMMDSDNYFAVTGQVFPKDLPIYKWQY